MNMDPTSKLNATDSGVACRESFMPSLAFKWLGFDPANGISCFGSVPRLAVVLIVTDMSNMTACDTTHRRENPLLEAALFWNGSHWRERSS